VVVRWDSDNMLEKSNVVKINNFIYSQWVTNIARGKLDHYVWTRGKTL
jgi:hypothetical protein